MLCSSVVLGIRPERAERSEGTERSEAKRSETKRSEEKLMNQVEEVGESGDEKSWTPRLMGQEARAGQVC